jgi:hypothetical protein
MSCRTLGLLAVPPARRVSAVVVGCPVDGFFFFFLRHGEEGWGTGMGPTWAKKRFHA